MSEHFNELTPAESERLAMLAEECGEVIQIIGKIMRHGYSSSNPYDSKHTPNRELLDNEMRDVFSVWQQLTFFDGGTFPTPDVLATVWAKKLQYSHHQETPGF